MAAAAGCATTSRLANTAATAAKARISQNGVVLSQDFALPFPGLQTVECTHLAGTSPN